MINLGASTEKLSISTRMYFNLQRRLAGHYLALGEVSSSATPTTANQTKISKQTIHTCLLTDTIEYED